MRNRFTLLALGALLFPLFFSSCYERQEGCTDFNAVNFNASADDHCCCNYPEFSFQLQHRFGPDSVRFFTDSVYTLDNGLEVNILFLELLASNFFLEQESGERQMVENTLEFSSVDGISCPCTDDLFIIDPNSFNATPGEISRPWTYTGLGFSSGTPEEWQVLTPDDFEDVYPLAQDERYDAEAMDFYSLRAVIAFPNATSEPVEINIPAWRSSLFFEENLSLQTAENFSVILRINYKTWLGGLNAGNVSEDTLVDLFTNNLEDALELILN